MMMMMCVTTVVLLNNDRTGPTPQRGFRQGCPPTITLSLHSLIKSMKLQVRYMELEDVMERLPPFIFFFPLTASSFARPLPLKWIA
jgi:hypothetical protein